MWSYCGETPQTWTSYLSGGEKTRDLSYLPLNKTKIDCLGRTIYSKFVQRDRRSLYLFLSSGARKLISSPWTEGNVLRARRSISLYFFLGEGRNSFLFQDQKGWMYCVPEDLSLPFFLLSLSPSLFGSEKAYFSPQNRRDESIAACRQGERFVLPPEQKVQRHSSL